LIILKNKNSDFIYLDVVTKYSQTLSSKVSQHPVDGLGVISDHITQENPKLSITGFLSGADFNFSKPRLSSEDRGFIGIGQIVVDSDIATEIQVSNDDNPTNLLPDVVGQFFSDTLPEVTGLSENRKDSYTEKALFLKLESLYLNRDVLSVFEFNDGAVVDSFLVDVVITNLTIKESTETGDALAFDITLEQITFAKLLETRVPVDVAEDRQNQVKEEAAKGDKSTNEVAADEGENDRTVLRSLVPGEDVSLGDITAALGL